MKSRLLYVAMALVILVLAAALSGRAEENSGGPPPVREIPGINAEDAFPRGCVDCHIVRTDINRDVRISTLLNEWGEKVEPRFLEMAQAAAPEGVTLVGKHPAVSSMVKDIPSGCMACHGKTSKAAPPLGRMMHLYHLTGGEKNPYMTVFHGECTYCHKLNQATGEWTIPSGQEK